jgi:hypothetical protein
VRAQGNGATPPFTARFGISITDGHATFDELLRAADRALYHSKHSGRDRITLADGARDDDQSSDEQRGQDQQSPVGSDLRWVASSGVTADTSSADAERALSTDAA